MRETTRIHVAGSDPVAAGQPAHDAPWERVRRGDVAAFDMLYDELAPSVYDACLQILLDPALAADASQDTLVQVWRRAPQVDLPSGSVMRWACTIAHRRSVDGVGSLDFLGDDDLS